MITFTQQPTGIYPAYNDSYVEFTSDLADNYKAEITLYPASIFTRVFTIYADAQGRYIFNLIDALRAVLNTSGLSDSFDYSTTAYFASFNTVLYQMQMTIKVISDESSESEAKTYEFFRAIKQVGEPIYSNDSEVLSYSKDGVNFDLSYFEGYPFFFDIKKIEGANTEVKIKNLNNSYELVGQTSADGQSFKWIVDKSNGENWTLQNVLPLFEGQNRCEMHVNGVFSCNISIHKIKPCKGIYLKWLNRNGSYSHYLFDRWYRDSLQTSEVGRVFQDQFRNIGQQNGNKASTGKTGVRNISARAKYRERDLKNLQDLFTSPSVQMYSSQEPNVAGTWIDVFVVGSMTSSNKKLTNEVSVTIELPELLTIKL